MFDLVTATKICENNSHNCSPLCDYHDYCNLEMNDEHSYFTMAYTEGEEQLNSNPRVIIAKQLCNLRETLYELKRVEQNPHNLMTLCKLYIETTNMIKDVSKWDI